MHNPAATIYCPNFTCQSPNPETNKFCQQCRTPLPKRYLWAVGAARLQNYQPGDSIGDRYIFKGEKILLETKPGIQPEIPELPDFIIPYLRLFPHRLNVPQVYGKLPRQQNSPDADIWLLEEAPLYPEEVSSAVPKGEPAEPQVIVKVMPTLTESWQGASPMRQLNWLWQMAQLWQFFSKERVAATLLNPRLLRVEGPILRLLELQADPQHLSLSELTQLWSPLVSQAHPAIAPYLDRLCHILTGDRVRSANQLITLLDRALSACGQLHKRTYHVATATDQGPTRRRNEDACYPPSGSTTSATSGSDALAIVCDGIGGHEGGNVASNLAIEAVQKHLQPLLGENAPLDPQTLIVELERSAAVANDAISEQNDGEQRQGRQRMGTTLVMALAHRHEIYLNHVGDSRAYWITHTGCRQVTVDDDVASREVRLGYNIYREALQQPAAGSLIQALGMSASALLHPTVQRFIVDEDSVFLLCSDGLSDNDRVEQYWDTEILPILKGDLKLSRSVTKLIDIGNFHNGHDNVTVALVYCQVEPIKSAGIDPGILVAQLEQMPAETEEPTEDRANTEDTQRLESPNARTKLIASRRRSPFSVPIVLGIALILSGGALAAWLATESLKNGMGNFPLAQNPTVDPAASPNGTPLPDTSSQAAIEPGAFIQIRSSIVDRPENDSNLLLLREQGGSTRVNVMGMVPAGSVLQVKQKLQPSAQQDWWVKLQVCSTPGEGDNSPESAASSQLDTGPESSSPLPSPVAESTTELNTRSLVPPGQIGWMRESQLVPQVLPNSTPTQEQMAGCTAEPSAPTSPETEADVQR